MNTNVKSSVIIYILLGTVVIAFSLPFIIVGANTETRPDIVLNPRYTATATPVNRALTREAFANLFFTPTFTSVAGITNILTASKTPSPTATATVTATMTATRTPTLTPTPSRTPIPFTATSQEKDPPTSVPTEEPKPTKEPRPTRKPTKTPKSSDIPASSQNDTPVLQSTTIYTPIKLAIITPYYENFKLERWFIW